MLPWLRPGLGRPVVLLLIPLGLGAHPCESCHPKEVAGYSHSSMARSLRRPGNEPEGAFTAPGSATRFTIHSDSKGTWQRMERAGEVSEYKVAYVIGSGNHAAGYLIQAGDHLFQSPVCYYTNRRAYDLAPGFERISEPDFSGRWARSVSSATPGGLCMLPARSTSTRGRYSRKRRYRANAATVWRMSTCGGQCLVLSSIPQNWRRRPATVSASNAIWRV